MGRPASGVVVACGRRLEREPQAADLRAPSSVAGHRGGPARSSDEGPVTGLERRGRVVRVTLAANRLWGEEPGERAKAKVV
jgi:hypothetical protein